MNYKTLKNEHVKFLMPLILSFIALAVQWGVVTTKLDVFESEIKNLVKSNELLTTRLSKVQAELAFIKGKIGE